MSGGVSTAAKTKMPKKTNLRQARSLSYVTQPMRVAMKMAMGSSNTTPNGSTKENRKPTYLSMESMGVARSSPATRKKLMARSYTKR